MVTIALVLSEGPADCTVSRNVILAMSMGYPQQAGHRCFWMAETRRQFSAFRLDRVSGRRPSLLGIEADYVFHQQR